MKTNDDEDIDPKTAALLFEVKKNQLKMIARRGYNIDREKGLYQLSLQQFLQTYIPFAKQQGRSFRSVLTNVYEKSEQGEQNGDKDIKRILVYYADVSATASQLGTSELTDAVSFMDKFHLRDGIIITSKPLSPAAKNNISELSAYNIQVFLEDEMSYDPTEHFLVPKHIPLTPMEARMFLEQNKLSVDQMPIIKSSDIIIRNLGLRGGRIVKIVRDNMYETSIISSVCYKLVIED